MTDIRKIHEKTVNRKPGMSKGALLALIFFVVTFLWGMLAMWAILSINITIR